MVTPRFVTRPAPRKLKYTGVRNAQKVVNGSKTDIPEFTPQPGPSGVRPIDPETYKKVVNGFKFTAPPVSNGSKPSTSIVTAQPGPSRVQNKDIRTPVGNGSILPQRSHPGIQYKVIQKPGGNGFKIALPKIMSQPGASNARYKVIPPVANGSNTNTPTTMSQPGGPFVRYKVIPAPVASVSKTNTATMTSQPGPSGVQHKGPQGTKAAIKGLRKTLPQFTSQPGPSGVQYTVSDGSQVINVGGRIMKVVKAPTVQPPQSSTSAVSPINNRQMSLSLKSPITQHPNTASQMGVAGVRGVPVKITNAPVQGQRVVVKQRAVAGANNGGQFQIVQATPKKIPAGAQGFIKKPSTSAPSLIGRYGAPKIPRSNGTLNHSIPGPSILKYNGVKKFTVTNGTSMPGPSGLQNGGSVQRAIGKPATVSSGNVDKRCNRSMPDLNSFFTSYKSDEPVDSIPGPSGIHQGKFEIVDPENDSYNAQRQVILSNISNVENQYQEKYVADALMSTVFKKENNLKRRFETNLDYAEPKRVRVELEEMDNGVELGVAETYSTYMPSKLKVGKQHPDPVVETASLASVAPVDVWYKLSLPQRIIDEGILSALQLESITYACQAHAQMLPNGRRAGFLIGDGAGVGKGRTIAGMIYENFLKGRKRAVWVSVSNDLQYDAMRDLRDIGADMPIHLLNKMKYSYKIGSSENGYNKSGVLFCTYSSLIGESNKEEGKFTNRKEQIVQWCHRDFDGLLIFDECHKAKNLCPSGSMKSTKTGQMVLKLQEHLPKARVLYASATGASEPKNMAYMARLGLWGPGTTFRTFDDFAEAVEAKGVGGMEIVAMDMKLRGMYIARQLSFQDVKFTIHKVKLSKKFISLYNASVDLWVEAYEKFEKAARLVAANKNIRKTMWGQFWSAHQRFFRYMCVAAKVDETIMLVEEAIKKDCCVVIGLQNTGEAGTLDQLEKEGELCDFVSTAKGVFQNLIEKHFPSSNKDLINKILARFNVNKVAKPTISYAEKKLQEKRKQKSLFALTTNESEDEQPVDVDESDDELDCYETEESVRRKEEKMRILRQKEEAQIMEDMNNQVDLIFKVHFGKKKKKAVEAPPKRDKVVVNTTKEEDENREPTSEDLEQANEMKNDLLQKLEVLGKRLPKNTLDGLIDKLGGPDKVAEMTGRKGRLIQTVNGVQYVNRSDGDVSLETLNVKERERFQNGEKLVAIISEAASSGISLQSDRRALNKRKRYHITLELPWSADKAVQQFGRTHRSNQVSAPEYVFVITNLAGEQRFASTVAKRLESLGALTHGDRRASDSRDLSQFNIDNNYGKAALDNIIRAVIGKTSPLVAEPRPGFLKDVSVALLGVGLLSVSKEGILIAEKEHTNISKFLNRILGVHVCLQNKLFRYFQDTMNAYIEKAKREGTFDLGILDLGANDRNVIRPEKSITFMYKHATGIAPIELHTLMVEGGLSWDEALQKFNNEAEEDCDGFYISINGSNDKFYVILLIETKSSKKKKKDGDRRLTMYRPNTGQQNKPVVLSTIEAKYRKVDASEIKNLWIEQYNYTECTHKYWSQPCPSRNCEVGVRRRTYHVLAGSVLPIWIKIENATSEKITTRNNKMQVIRLKTVNDMKIVGTLIQNHLVGGLIDVLKAEAENVVEKGF